MKWLKICALLIAVLAVMRAGSWVLGWILAKFAPIRASFVAVIANLTAFGVFVFFLVRDLLPGEPVDVNAILFGVAVFLVCCWSDFYWRPWKTRG
jgi:hypothetical protein